MIKLLILYLIIPYCTGKAFDGYNHKSPVSDGSSIYVEYLPSTGGFPLILAAPHGGVQAPSSIPNRDAGCWNSATGSCVWSHQCGTKDTSRCAATTARDVNTYEMTIEVRSSLCALFNGACPAAILNLLHRSKFDANRDVDEATFGVPVVVDAFHAFHGYIEAEKQRISLTSGRGLFLDMHGHGHAVQRAELGYLLTGAQLDSANPINPNVTSIRSLAASSGINFDSLLRGIHSFGGYLEEAGFRAVPSPVDRGPGGLAYFSGGYNTREHGSVNDGKIDAIQIESSRETRDLPTRVVYVQALSRVIQRYLCDYYINNAMSMSSNMSSPEGNNLRRACNLIH